MHRVNNLPITFFNRKDDPARKRTVHLALDAPAEQIQWNWIPAQMRRASADMSGPVWIRGCQVTVQQPGSLTERPSVNIASGIAQPLEVWDGKHYSKRVDVPDTSGLVITSPITLVAVQADSTSAGGGSVVVIPLTSQRLRAAQFETFYYLPPSSSLDLMVPLALVILDATPPYGVMSGLSDIRPPHRGFVTANRGSEWKIPFAGYVPNTSALTNHTELQDETNGFWIEIGGNARPPYGPPGKFHGDPGQPLGEDNPVGIWMMIPRGFEVETGLTCMVRGRNTLLATPSLDGVDIVSEGSDAQIFELDPQDKTKQGNLIPRTLAVTALVPNPVPGVHFLSWVVKGEGIFDRARNFDAGVTAYVGLSNIQIRARLVKALEEQEFIRDGFN